MCNSIIATMLDVVPHLDSDLQSKLHAIQLSYELSYTCSEIAVWMSILLRVGHIYPAMTPQLELGTPMEHSALQESGWTNCRGTPRRPSLS